ncbi:hypothetical protein HN51_004454, partial [Arachis hypogaea]
RASMIWFSIWVRYKDLSPPLNSAPSFHSHSPCKIQEIRDIATMEGIQGKHFFLEANIKGLSLKLDNTGRQY